jgi:apolipoprotein N-acyltransferase
VGAARAAPVSRLAVLLSTCAGALCVLAFEPFGLWVLAPAMLALLFTQWQVAAPRAAAAQGFAFGLGIFGAGVPWLFVAQSGFGEMPWPAAAAATFGVMAYLAAWPALTGYAAARFTKPGGAARLVACAAAWTLGEWLRGYVFTGMPWLSLGYAAPAGGPLVAYAPLGGVFLVTLSFAALAACIARAIDVVATGRLHTLVAPIAVAAVVFGLGFAAARVTWTTPVDPPLAVSLLQGNVGQDVKFDRSFRQRTFDLYLGLVAQSRGQLVVLPESAFPMFADQVPGEVVLDLMQTGAQRNGLVLLGLFTADAPLPGSRDPRYYNTVAALGGGEVSLYRKRHLVPFGETIPLKSLVAPIMDALLEIPLADQTAGDAQQPAFSVAAHRVAVNICYEDAFGSELIGSARDADILVNVTNDAWYGRSIAAWQHNQIAAMRARELGRPMLRATNTGVTSAIDADGREFARLPWFTQGVLEVSVRGTRGLTPYARIGDAGVLVVAGALLLGAALYGRRR